MYRCVRQTDVVNISVYVCFTLATGCAHAIDIERYIYICCICICIHVYMYVNVYVYVYIYNLCMYVYVCVCVCMYMCMYIYKSICIFAESQHAFTGVVEHHACADVYVKQML